MVHVYEYTPDNRELLCYNATHSLSIFQRVEVFSKVGCSRTEACDHCCASISSQGILQQPGDLGLTIRNMGGLSLWVSQGTYDIAKCKKTTVDVHRFCRTYEMKNYCVPEKLWGRKISQISRFCGYLQKFSPWNLGAWCPLARQKQAIRGSFLRESLKIIFFTNLWLFSPAKVSHYTVLICEIDINTVHQ